ncbi:ABC transporter permease [Blautia stercoris]
MREPTVRTQKIHRNHLKLRLIIFGGLALALVIASYFSESLCPYDPYLQDLGNAKAIPSAAHLFGTDRYGRDMLSRVIVGSKTSIYSTLLLVGFIMVFGTMIGIFCAWSGKKIDSVLMRISDVFLAFPGLVFALAVAAALGGGVHNAIIALAASAGQSMRVLQGVKRWHKKKQFI